ncbi:FAD-binding oxidoreductase [Lichenihabitans sp. PAMC28606]|uniref:NAD(P)/FAD-dependent oxidoreductase n=1 Tax=Lichenihabitans sp. PAMC28606 TaxID=2880932 RepID=UPI001D0A57DD|nr:FAD-dependent oxidoreductase [Lichenihabitans sp. PAMC28606]UDL93660.1 FAD-binding oxidoreductase [Lichenihabitans sp. PAMC28606]
MSEAQQSSIVDVDVAVIGAGAMGATVALHLARGGMTVALIDRGDVCREASGVNAGTLTLHMTRAALIPYAMRGRQLWIDAPEWLGSDVGARSAPGLSLAFTPAEQDMLEKRAAARSAMGAPIRLVTPAEARQIEPGLNEGVIAAAYCELDGHVTAYLTGRAYRQALLAAGVSVMEHSPVDAIHRHEAGFDILVGGCRRISAKRLVLAGGVWLETMLAWIGLRVPVKCLVNQLIVTERMRPVMRSVVGIANGLLSLKQFENGSVLIGGGWQGIGDPQRGGVEANPDNLVGNVRLARHAIPALAETRILRIWLGLESETADAMPMIGPLPGIDDAYVIGCVHSGYTSAPYMGLLLAERILGREPEMPLFDPARLILPDPVGQPDITNPLEKTA